jgi:transposase
MQTLSNWLNKAKEGKFIGTKQHDPELMSILEENKHLKSDLKVAHEERDILKKATE